MGHNTLSWLCLETTLTNLYQSLDLDLSSSIHPTMFEHPNEKAAFDDSPRPGSPCFFAQLKAARIQKFPGRHICYPVNSLFPLDQNDFGKLYRIYASPSTK